MYCKKCGLEIDDETYFCPECGSQIDRNKIHVKSQSEPTKSDNIPNENQIKEQYVNNIVTPQKNPGIAVILALIIGIGLMGMGHMYAGKIKDGAAFLIVGIFLDIMLLILIYKKHLSDLTDLSIIILIIVFVSSISLYIWQIYDAYVVTKEYNDAILKTGKAPW